MQSIKNDPQKASGKTVLVVDDNSSIRKLMSTAFLSDGFKTCAEADNGKDAIEVAKRVRPDLITLDLSMPVMNGLEAASELRKLFPNVPMILFTLFEIKHLELEASQAGIDLVLSKSDPLSSLVDAAHKLIRSGR